MTDQQVSVTFEPNGRTVSVLPGTKIVEAAARAGLTLETPCGGQGSCGKCRVRIASGACDATEVDRKVFDDAELADGWRLACQTDICGPSVVHVPENSLFAGHHQILTESAESGEAEVLPAVRKIYLEMDEPTLEDGRADLVRLEEAAGVLKADIDMVRELSEKLRREAFKGTVVLADHKLIDFEAGDTSGQCFGVAFDIGTTTISGSLLNLSTGDELAIVSRMNPQISFGDDVLSRIQYAGESKEGLAELQSLAASAVSEMIDELTSGAGVERNNIYELTFAGNTTMEHLLCGIDPGQLGHLPFVPVHGRALMMPARQLGITIHPRGLAYIFPVIGGFVGGDTVACMLATRITHHDGPVLLIDIGTNGEIVLAHKGKIWAASTAAGPAFEGARIACGMRATTGAVEKVMFDGDARFGVIGDVPATGICGSGLIDLVAELLRHGIVSPEGRIISRDELPGELSQPIAERVVEDDEGKAEFLIADNRQAKGGVRVALTQRDIRELQLASGAIRAGVSILLRNADLQSSDLQRVLIAGGFGSFIRRNNAQRLGLLPSDIHHERIQYVGNASLNGSRWALLSTRARKRAEELARSVVHVELSQDLNFQMEFAEAMIFPQ